MHTKFIKLWLNYNICFILILLIINYNNKSLIQDISDNKIYITLGCTFNVALFLRNWKI